MTAITMSEEYYGGVTLSISLSFFSVHFYRTYFGSLDLTGEKYSRRQLLPGKDESVSPSIAAWLVARQTQ